MNYEPNNEHFLPKSVSGPNQILRKHKIVRTKDIIGKKTRRNPDYEGCLDEQKNFL